MLCSPMQVARDAHAADLAEKEERIAELASALQLVRSRLMHACLHGMEELYVLACSKGAAMHGASLAGLGVVIVLSVW